MKGYHDLAGDGGSGIAEQIEAQRGRIVQSLAAVRHTLAVGSGKGGVGKSTLTRQLAVALTRRGLRVAIFDADLNGPSQAALGGIEHAVLVPAPSGLTLPRDTSGIGVVSLGSVLSPGQALAFDSVSRGETQVWRAAREFTAAAELLAAVEWGSLDLLLVDLPPGAERTVQWAEFLGPRTALVLVTLPSRLSRGVVARSLDALREVDHAVLGYVANMAGYRCPETERPRALYPDDRQTDLDLPCLGELPFDPDLADASDRGQSLPPEHATSRIVGGLAERLYALLENR